MKKAISFLMSFIMVVMLFPLNVLALELKEAEYYAQNGTVFEESVQGEKVFTTFSNVKYGPDEAILISLLNERSFVVDTLIHDYIPANNPNLGSEQDYLYKGILEHYEEDVTYAALVKIWDDAHNLGSVIMERPSDLVDIFLSDEDWLNFIKGVESKKYEQIISRILTSDYTSDSKITANEEQANTQYFREVYENTKRVKDFLSDSKKVNGAITNINDLSQIYYLNEFLPSYVNLSESYYSFVEDHAAGMVFHRLGPEEFAKLDGFFEIQYAGQYGIDSPETNKWKTSIELEHVTKDAGKALKTAGTVFDAGTSMLNYLLIFESVLGQQDMLIDVFERSLEYGSPAYDRMAKKYINILKDYDEPGDVILNAIMNTASDLASKELGKYAVKKIENWATTKAVEKVAVNGGMSTVGASVYVANIAQSVSTYLKAMEIAADVCFSFTDVAEKTYELTFINDVKNYFVLQYLNDVGNYMQSVSEGASAEERNVFAKKAIDDLIILKKIQLRANEIAYKMTSNLADKSLMGKIDGWMLGENASVGMEEAYNTIKNALVDTVINPFNMGIYVIEEGETLNIHQSEDGKNLYAVFQNKNGKTVHIGEFQYKIYEGIEVNGTLNVYADASATYIISNKVTGKINIYGNKTLSCLDMEGKFSIGGNGTLQVEKELETFYCEVGEKTSLITGGLKLEGEKYSNAQLWVSGIIEVNGDMNVKHGYIGVEESGYILVNGNYTSDSTGNDPKGVLEVKGDYEGLLPTEKLILSGDNHQNIHIKDAAYKIPKLEARNPNITTDTGFAVGELLSDLNIAGDVPTLSINKYNGNTVTVTGDAFYEGPIDGTLEINGNLKTKFCEVASGAKLIAGNLETTGNMFYYFDRLTVSGYIEINGDLYISRDSTLTVNDSGYIFVNGNFTCQGSGNSSEGATIEAKGNVSYYLTFPAEKLILSGSEPQNIYAHGSYKILALMATNRQITTDTGFAVGELLSDLNIEGDVPILSVDNCNGNTVKVNGNLIYEGMLDGTLEATGKIKTNDVEITEGAKLVAGELELGDNWKKYSSKIYGSIEVNGNMRINEHLSIIFGDETHITVNGDFTSLEKSSGKGTIEVKGNVTGGYGFPAEKLLLSGDKPQNVYISKDNNIIPALEATNKQITTDTGFAITNLLSDVYLIEEPGGEITVENYNGYSIIILGNIIYGDVDCNEKINVLDANFVRRFAAKLVELNEKQLIAADVNNDGKVNVMDANLIRRYAAKLIDKFPAEE